MQHLKKVNLYLLAFIAILTKALIFTLGWPEVALLGAILLVDTIRKQHARHLDFKEKQNDTTQLKGIVEELARKYTQLENTVKFKLNGKQ